MNNVIGGTAGDTYLIVGDILVPKTGRLLISSTDKLFWINFISCWLAQIIELALRIFFYSGHHELILGLECF